MEAVRPPSLLDVLCRAKEEEWVEQGCSTPPPNGCLSVNVQRSSWGGLSARSRAVAWQGRSRPSCVCGEISTDRKGANL